MELNEMTMKIIAEFLEKTLSPDPNVRRPAEKQLEQYSMNENYGLILLMLAQKQDISMHLRVSASINFKNYIKKNWPIDEDQQNKITLKDRDSIKSSIVALMLTSPDQIQRQLSDAISIISKEDFPEKWQNLLPDMVDKMKSGDFNVINGVLRTAHSIFKRYRHEFQSNELWKEIKYVLGVFAGPLTELFVVRKHSLLVYLFICSFKFSRRS
jgi:exportin-2 (importin alpha re-exporter)